MFSVVRGSLRVLFIRGEREPLEAVLASGFPLRECSFPEALNTAGEGQTVAVFPGNRLKERKCLVVSGASDEILGAFVNHGSRWLRSVRLVPRIILFRVFGDRERVLAEMEKDFHGVRGTLKQVFRWRCPRGEVAICFTMSPLNRVLSLEDLMDEVLFPEKMSYDHVYASLRNRGMMYFREGLENRKWNGLEIRIYDSWGNFREHLERVRIVFQGLDAVVVLSEGWGKDYAHILMPVTVYRLEIVTFLSPGDVKKILLGLEYSKKGMRIVDLDLYFGGEKVSWGGLARRKNQREELGREMREMLLERLHPADLEKLDAAEEALVSLRKP